MNAAGRPLVVAHRGGMGEACEGTLAAFATARERGADGVELDVHPSADGVLVVHHDPTLARTAHDPRRIRELTWEQLRRVRIDCGGVLAPLPRLEEVLEATPGLWLSVDLKDDQGPSAATEERLVACLRTYDALERTVVASFRRAPLERLRARWTTVRTAAAPVEVAAWLAGAPPAFQVLSVPPRWRGVPLASRWFVARAHAQGRAVWVWTVNDPHAARELVAHGVDAIITDVPRQLAGWLSAP